MPRRAGTPCSRPGCPNPAVREGTCAQHYRGTARARGYDTKHRTDFRAAVLKRDPTCTWLGCTQPATEADHWPYPRTTLELLNIDPNDPANGRGLCRTHHRLATADQHS
jgi:5-methylcytosine-specific restriction protein A